MGKTLSLFALLWILGAAPIALAADTTYRTGENKVHRPDEARRHFGEWLVL
jgi:hypothetical protein